MFAPPHGSVVFALWPNAKLIGLTATPERLDGKGLGQHFAEMVSGPEIAELVKMRDPDTGLPYLRQRAYCASRRQWCWRACAQTRTANTDRMNCESGLRTR